MSNNSRRFADTRIAFLLKFISDANSPCRDAVDTEEIVHIVRPEVLAPRGNDPIADAPKIPQAAFSPPLDLTEFARTLQQIASTLGIELPEGFLDASGLRSRNFRIQSKSERLALIAGFQMRVNGIVRLKCDEADEVRRHNLIRFKQVLDALFAWRMAAEEHYRVFLARERVENERSIEAARTRAEIAKYEAEALQYRNQNQLPPAAEKDPVEEVRTRAEIAKYEAEEAKHKREARDANREPVPPRTREEANTIARERLRMEIERLTLQEEREIKSITRGAPESQWTPEVEDEVKHIQNRYASLREDKRQEMERFL